MWCWGVSSWLAVGLVHMQLLRVAAQHGGLSPRDQLLTTVLMLSLSSLAGVVLTK